MTTPTLPKLEGPGEKPGDRPGPVFLDLDEKPDLTPPPVGRNLMRIPWVARVLRSRL